jgi:hypothetical protein
MAPTTSKRAKNDAAYKMIVHAWSKNDRFPGSTVVSNERSMPHDSLTAMGGQACAAQMLAVEFWIGHLQLICERRAHHLTFPSR